MPQVWEAVKDAVSPPAWKSDPVVDGPAWKSDPIIHGAPNDPNEEETC